MVQFVSMNAEHIFNTQILISHAIQGDRYAGKIV